MTLLIREHYINETTNTRFGDSDWFEAFTDDRNRLFRSLQREYGRCESRMYITSKTEEAQPVGWVFKKRMRYEDAKRNPDTGKYSEKDYYIREVWVEVRVTPLCSRCGKDEDAHHEFVVSDSGGLLNVAAVQESQR